jgi:hypothetical protein
MSSQELDKLLAALREDSRGVEAPRHVEAALLGAFRAQARKPSRAWMPWAIAAAAVVVVASGAALSVKWMDQPVPPSPEVRLAVAPPAPAFALAMTPKAAPPRRIKTVPHPTVEPSAQPVQEVATDFMPLEDSVGLPPIDSGHILRVQMPQSTMTRFGFPVNPDRMLDPVKADVVFGQDGIARAVRFVK